MCPSYGSRATITTVTRRILRKLSRGVVLKRYLPTEFGSAPMFVSPECALSYWRRDLARVDPFLFSMVRELVHNNGTTVWDIGANVGLFSFAAAAKGAQVLAVEADTWLASLLHRSVLLNGLPVTVVPAAVASVPGITKLSLSDQGRASNSLQGTGPSQTVVSITLDWLAEYFAPPKVLKIDVEGMEYEVLKGAGTLLHRHQPAIFCEVTRNHDSVGQLLREAGYTMYPARAQTRHPLNRPSYDTLALPSAH